jgi:predicted TPR repeat methyltransferase
MYHALRTRPGHYEPPTREEEALAAVYQQSDAAKLQRMDTWGRMAHFAAMAGNLDRAKVSMQERHEIEIQLDLS